MMIIGGVQSQVNTTTAQFQGNASISSLSDGGWVVAWQSYAQDSSDNGVYLQRYDASGAAVGGETLVNVNTYLDQAEPDVVGLADGGWVVTWQSYWQVYSDWSIYQQAYDSDGNVVWSEHAASSAGGDPAVAALDDGRWFSVSSASSTYFNTTLSNPDTLSNAAGTISSPYGELLRDADIAVLADGGWVVTWSSSYGGTDYGIRQTRYNAAGSRVSGNDIVDTNGTGEQTKSAVAALADGGWVVVWQSDASGDMDIVLQRYNSSGMFVGSETRVNTTTSGSQSLPAIAGLDNGGWVVVWQGEGSGDSAGIFQQVYDSAGNTVGTETLVNTVTTGSQIRPTVTVLADGSWVVSWGGSGTADTEGVYQRAFNINDAPVVAHPIVDPVATEDTAFSFTIPANAFSDADGDALTYSAELAGGGSLPAWLSFDAATRTFSGTPLRGDIGSISVDITVEDVHGQTVTDTVEITVSPLNHAPTASLTIADQDAAEGSPFSFQFPANVFSDVDSGDSITYSARLASGGSLPAWLSFDAATRTFSGTPGKRAAGEVVVALVATDQSGASASMQFSIVVGEVYDGPLATGGTIELDQGGTHRFEIADFGIADGEGLGAIVIQDLPGLGKLRFDGKLVTAGTEIDVDDLSQLTWRPKGEGTGDGYASFIFVPVDGDGDRADDTATITFDVNAVANRIVGGAGRQTLRGTEGDDIIVGGRGNDILIGGKGVDIFVFGTGDGRDVIRDFAATGKSHDILDLTGLDAITSFKDLMKNHVEAFNGGVRIDAGNGDVIVLEGVKPGQLDAGDFLF